MRDAFGRHLYTPNLGLLVMGWLLCATVTVAGCGGADEPLTEAADALAMAGADEWLDQNSIDRGSKNGLPERSNQGGL